MKYISFDRDADLVIKDGERYEQASFERVLCPSAWVFVVGTPGCGVKFCDLAPRPSMDPQFNQWTSQWRSTTVLQSCVADSLHQDSIMNWHQVPEVRLQKHNCLTLVHPPAHSDYTLCAYSLYVFW